MGPAGKRRCGRNGTGNGIEKKGEQKSNNEEVVEMKNFENKDFALSEPEIIGIDHGWSYMKTAKEVFASGVKEISTEPAFFDDILEYKKKFYKIGTGRMEVKANKVESQDYYYLTLAAIAKELKNRGKSEGPVVIAAGLPASRYGDEKRAFQEYLGREEEIYFKYENLPYHVWIKKVYVYPQCYPAVVDRIALFGPKVIVVDIGSWTIDVVPVIDRKPDDSGINSIPQGIITCMKKINKECVRQFGEKIDEGEITSYILSKRSGLADCYLRIMEKEIRDFASMVVGSLREEQYGLLTTPFVFVGGGAVLMKNFGDFRNYNFTYVTDVKANARGYEALARLAASKGGRRDEQK